MKLPFYWVTFATVALTATASSALETLLPTPISSSTQNAASHILCPQFPLKNLTLFLILMPKRSSQ